jgi:hypothetical protein
MNFQITTLAETMSANEFIVELNHQGIDYDIETMDDVYDANNGDCNIAMNDLVYCFSEGELINVAIVEM